MPLHAEVDIHIKQPELSLTRAGVKELSRRRKAIPGGGERMQQNLCNREKMD